MKRAAIIKAFKKYQTFLISTHVNVDPDALTSELAVAFYLKQLGKKVTIVNDEELPKRFNFLPGSQQVKKFTRKMRATYDVAIIVDCGELNRIGVVQEMIPQAKKIINIDHHITNKNFGDLNCVVPNASSTAEIIYDLIKKGGVKVTDALATLLYVGIMTDTGSFRYDNTSDHTHKVVSELMEYKIPVNKLYGKVYETASFDDMTAFVKVFQHVESFFNKEVICVELRKQFFNKFSHSFDLRDKIFSFLRSIEGTDVIVIFTEHTKNIVRVNFRSKKKVDVAKLSSEFGGGGHKRASGCSINLGMKQAKKKVLAEIKKVL